MGFYLLDNPNPHGPFYRTSRPTAPRVIVLHTAENNPDLEGVDEGAENIARYASTTTRKVSWHATVDSDSIIRMLPDEYEAWHVRGYNDISLGVEMATKAADWTQVPYAWRVKVIDNCAKVVAAWCEKWNIPVRIIGKAEVDSGGSGITFHRHLDPTRRTDPGVSFPHPYFLDRVKIHLSPFQPSDGTKVMGTSEASRAQAKAWLIPPALRKGSPYPEDTLTRIVDLYWQVGAEYGVRADLALAQAAKETGFFTFGGDVRSSQWNFAGIGATGGVSGYSFPSIEAGVRAHVLRMRMYAVNDPAWYDERVLARPLPQRLWGRCPTIESFNGVWAVPGVGYGQSIVNDYLHPMVETFLLLPDDSDRPTVSIPLLTADEIGIVRKIINWWRSR